MWWVIGWAASVALIILIVHGGTRKSVPKRRGR